jgi:hypothetical protein
MFKFDTIIGIDPGAAGGLAVFQPGKITRTVKMPKDIRNLGEFFGYYAENFRPLVFLEKLSVRPDDVADNPGKIYRIQQMLANYEHLKALLENAGVPYVLVHPMSWQTKLGLRSLKGHEDKKHRKARYKLKAAKEYPECRITLWNADALLIMHFGRWAVVNDRNWVLANLPGYIKEGELFSER